MAQPAAFDGFSLGLLHFLEQLSRNNSRAWFEQNKACYEQELREPALAFIAAMEKPLGKFSPHFQAVPKKVGGSLMRIHRDVRFSKDKSPYKTNVGIHFRHERGKDVHCPGVYVHIDTSEVFLGVGIWHPASDALAAIRNAIVADPNAWKRVSQGKAFQSHFELRGDSLKLPPRGYEAEHPLIEDLKRKDHIAVCQLDHDDLFDTGLVKKISTRMNKAKSYLEFLCRALEVGF